MAAHAVNVAARIESATRQTGDHVLVADRTLKLLHDAPVELVERPQIELKGKGETVRVFAPNIESSHLRGNSSVP